jgi:indolepyruvate ferredoxin oxidoreductase beta subunit
MPNRSADAPDLVHARYDIYLVGVGGQGVLTIGELITDAAFQRGIPVNFYPTKGMAQRGGAVKAQLRLGRATTGPAIPERGADLIIATEVSEALKSVRYIKPGGDFVLYGHVWAPTAVLLGKAPYPALDQVLGNAREALGPAGSIHYISPADLPWFEGSPVPDNIFTLAVAMSRTRLAGLLPQEAVRDAIRTRWKRGVERNAFAFQAGLDAQLKTATTSEVS